MRLLLLLLSFSTLTACSDPADDAFGSTDSNKVDEGADDDGADDDTSCTRIRGGVLLAEGLPPPPDGAAGTVYLFRLDSLSADGFPIGKGPVVDIDLVASGPQPWPLDACAVPGDFDALILVDTDGDGELCGQGDLHGWGPLTVPAEGLSGASVTVTELLTQGCPR